METVRRSHDPGEESRRETEAGTSLVASRNRKKGHPVAHLDKRPNS